MKPKFSFFITFVLVLVSAFPLSAQTSKPDFNRPHSYDVQHYILRVSFDRAKKKVFGDTTVQLKPVKTGFREVELDATNLEFEQVTLESNGTALKYKATDERIVVTLDKSYSPNDLISLRFKYSAKPKKGIYFIPEQKENGQVVRSAQIWTQGEPDEARHWFPSFDFPSDKATTEEIITVDKGETVIGNGELLSQKENADGTATFHFKMPVPHSTYLVSFVVGVYSKVSETYKQIPLGFYIYPGGEAIVPKAFGKTKDILRVFEDITGVNYPYNKYDQTIVAGFSFGGMENITATTMADTEIFLANDDFGKATVEDLVSHETAHSWFGNLVTCENWAELWLNEGFATFMEAAFREKMYGRDSYDRKIASDAEIFLADEAANRKRNGLFNLNADDVDALFDRPATTYNKGSAIIHTLRETIGEKAFWNGLTLYLNRHKFANVESGDLQKAMEETSGTNLDWFFNQWVYGVGSPKLEVRQTYDAKSKTLKLTIEQTQKMEKFAPAAYRLPMDVEIETAAGVKTEKLEITKRVEKFSFRLAGEPTGLKFDRHQKIPIKTVKIDPVETAR